MAIDPNAPATTATPTPPVSAIENELPTYRAISPLAVGSLVLGVLGALAFANLIFVAASVLAVFVGVLGLLRIRQQPDVLTGRSFAQAGVALGLITGLSSVTMDFTQRLMLSRQAEAFVRDTVVPVLNERNLDGALWLKTHPDQRRGMTPEQVLEQYRENNKDPMTFEMMAGKVVRLNALMTDQPEAKVTFDSIERLAYDGITPIAVGLLRVEGLNHQEEAGAGHEHDEAEGDYLGVLIKGVGESGNQTWWVEDYVYPYQPNTLQEKVKPVDDGHGHGDAGH